MHPIINDLFNYMAKCGGTRAQWYVGIAADPRACLFSRHGVDEQSGAWIFVPAANDNEARAIERYLIDQGFDGGPGGGTSGTRYVYAFRKTANTRR